MRRPIGPSALRELTPESAYRLSPATLLTIRPEQPADVVSIRDVIQRAFAGMPYADGDEAELVEALRTEGALSVSLVAEQRGAVVGQIAFSPAIAADGSRDWYALGPVAVLPSHQRSRIGARLVLAGLRAIEELGAAGCILTGSPAYYSRFGFESSPEHTPIGEPAEFFMLKVLRGERPKGPIAFHAAFRSSSSAPASGNPS